MHNRLIPVPFAVLSVLLVSLGGCGNADAPSASAEPDVPEASQPEAAQPSEQTPLAIYQQEAAGVLAALEDPVDGEAAADAADRLMRQGADLVPAFVQRHPHCQPYLDAALVVVDGWQEMDLATIESDYHDDGALPEIENATVCYHLKDLFVHPATVLVILAGDDPDLGQARKEIQEVLAHASVVEASLR